MRLHDIYMKEKKKFTKMYLKLLIFHDVCGFFKLKFAILKGIFQ